MKNINPKYFRAFKAVVSCNSFSHAAAKAYMTQANISKHIQALEEQVGHQLFIRTNKNPVITEAGKSLLKYIERLDELNAELAYEITGNQQSLKGAVRYGLPYTALFNSQFARLREKWPELQGLEMTVDIEHAENLFARVLEGSLDFGFALEASANSHLTCTPCGHEEFLLVGRDREISTTLNSAESLLTTPWIDYPGMHACFDGWRVHFFPDSEEIHSATLYYAGHSNNLDSALQMVRGSMGVTLLPRSVAIPWMESGKLTAWQPADGKPFLAPVYLVQSANQQPPLRVSNLIQFFVPSA